MLAFSARRDLRALNASNLGNLTMASLLWIAWCLLGQATSDVRFVKVDGGTEIVAPLSAALQAKVPAGKLTQDQGEEWLRLCGVDPKSGKTGPPLFEAHRRPRPALMLRPAF